MHTTLLSPRPKPLKGGVLNRVRDMWVMPNWDDSLPPPPLPLTDLDLMQSIAGSGSTWREWSAIRGGGILSWLRLLKDGGNGLTDEERAQHDHYTHTQEHRCHRFRGYTYCFHRDPHIHPELKDVATDTPIAKEGDYGH